MTHIGKYRGLYQADIPTSENTDAHFDRPLL